jgi:hypothetical protein
MRGSVLLGLRGWGPTLVERITGQAHAREVNAEVQIVIPLDTLLDVNDPGAAELEGYGPLPADLARDLLATSKGRLWWRRLYASPVGGPIVGGDPYRRRFHGHLRQLIMWRDRQCRDPFCEARLSVTSTTSSATPTMA